MRVSRLQLVNYRNFATLDLRLAADLTVILGANAQGKTNLIDAMHILATGRSLRAGPEAAWVRTDAPVGAPFARVTATVQSVDRQDDVEMIVARTTPVDGVASGVRRRVRIGGAPRRLAELPGHLGVVSFAPADLALLTGAPAGRRRWLDIALTQVDQAYAAALSEFEQLLSRRNALLRRIKAGLARPAELDFWDESLGGPALALISRRRAYLRGLAPLGVREFAGMAGGGALGIAYAASLDAATEDEVRSILHKRRSTDVERQSTSIGPHRDDVRLTLDGLPLAHFASRGQVRLGALALKLAQFEMALAARGEAPVLLLDDIAAELDPNHRRLLFARLPAGAQAIVTTAEAAAIDAPGIDHAPRLLVEAGTVRRADVTA